MNEKRIPMMQFLLRVESRRPDGTPEILRWVKEEDNVELSRNGEENCFIPAFCKPMDFSQFAGQIVTPGLEESSNG